MTYLRYSCLALAISGCGLISSDVADFDLTLPAKKFSIDTAGWQIDATAAQTVLATSCASAPSVCNTAAMQACEMNCSGTCNAAQRCELQLDVSLYQPVDLVSEKPELKSINDQPVIKVTIDAVTYDVTANTLNVDTPELKVYVAPTSVMDPKSADATEIGSIPPVPAGTTLTGREIEFNATGKATLVSIMSSYKTPFNLLVGSSLIVTDGTPIPEGKLDALVHVRAHAGL